MRIRSIEISAFRCFRGHILIDTIDDGITLLVGDNEEGKSTVLAALQTVLFEKHTVGGAVAAAMLPYGSKVRPEIGLDFDHDGVHYRLSKAFCQKPMAELEAETGDSLGRGCRRGPAPGHVGIHTPAQGRGKARASRPPELVLGRTRLGVYTTANQRHVPYQSYWRA